MATREDQIEALNSVLNGLRVAQSRGVFSLEEAAILYQNIQTLSGQSNTPSPTESEEKRLKTSK